MKIVMQLAPSFQGRGYGEWDVTIDHMFQHAGKDSEWLTLSENWERIVEAIQKHDSAGSVNRFIPRKE